MRQNGYTITKRKKKRLSQCKSFNFVRFSYTYFLLLIILSSVRCMKTNRRSSSFTLRWIIFVLPFFALAASSMSCEIINNNNPFFFVLSICSCWQQSIEMLALLNTHEEEKNNVRRKYLHNMYNTMFSYFLLYLNTSIVFIIYINDHK